MQVLHQHFTIPALTTPHAGPGVDTILSYLGTYFKEQVGERRLKHPHAHDVVPEVNNALGTCFII